MTHPDALGEIDADTLAAALALSDLHHRSHPPTAVTTPSTLTPTPTSPPIHLATPSNPNLFLQRIDALPLVRPVLQAYETTMHSQSFVGKSARVVDKYSRWGLQQVDKSVGPGKMEEYLNEGLDYLERRNLIRPTLNSDQAGYMPVKSMSLDQYTVGDQPGLMQRAMITTTSLTSTTFAALSDDARKSLRYCLEWLAWAIQRIQAHTALLHKLTRTQEHQGALVHVPKDQAKRILQESTHQIIETLRNAIQVLSTHAGSYLPTAESKNKIRGFVLGLPDRWGALMRQQSEQASHDTHGEEESVEEGQRRVVVLAKETLDMLQGVQDVIRGVVERAEDWNQRLPWSNATPAPSEPHSESQDIPMAED